MNREDALYKHSYRGENTSFLFDGLVRERGVGDPCRDEIKCFFLLDKSREHALYAFIQSGENGSFFFSGQGLERRVGCSCKDALKCCFVLHKNRGDALYRRVARTLLIFFNGQRRVRRLSYLCRNALECGSLLYLKDYSKVLQGTGNVCEGFIQRDDNSIFSSEKDREHTLGIHVESRKNGF